MAEATAAVPESYNQEKAIQAYLSSTNLEPLQTTQGILASIQSIANLESNAARLPPHLRGIAAEELKWIRRGMIAINQSPALQSKIGKDWNSAVVASGLLKQMHAAKMMEEILAPYAFPAEDQAEARRRSAFS